MHTFSINSEERKSIICILGFLSIALVLILKNNVCLPAWVPVPSAFAVFGSLYWLFDQFIWKWSWVNSAFLKTPNLNGNWQMLMKSSLDNYTEEYEGALTITQTWTRIHLFLDGEKFTGRSTMAGIEVHTSKEFTLKWEYLSQRKYPHAVNEYMHYGITKVRMLLGSDPVMLEGDYYADRSRHTSGPVRLIKKA